MRFSLTTVLAFAALASACYSGGENWDNVKDNALRAIENQCRRWENVWFTGGENKYGCENIGSNKRINIRMRNGDNGGPSRQLDYNTCVQRIQSQVHNCRFGGEENQGAWRPRADPNTGPC